MSLDAALVGEIVNSLENLLAEEKKPLTEIRRRYPGLHFSQCDAADMTDEPFRAGKHFDLYLVDGRSACLHITHDLAEATGLVLAMH
ncbi:MAG: DUF6129 family protein [Sulfuricellaceae bacterium]